uniref:KIAA0586 n=1 Tax=Terrapene triunguis TaxID=2587831 RepID=A0A674JZV9_9SAUR
DNKHILVFTISMFCIYRTQNPPVFKEVKVQLLENVSTEKKESAQDTRSAHSNIDSATTIAAATAAAIATTAPLLKVQSDLEAKVSSVSALLNKLQETDKQLQRVAEQQTNIKTQQQERSRCHDRVNELEKQMHVFMEQRIQHLEKLQQQQIHVQSHLISSAINTGCFQPVNIPSSNLVAKHSTNPERQQPLTTYPSQFGKYGVRTQKSPLRTPAPRRYAPVPVSKDVKISQKISKKERPIAEKENVPKSAYGSVVGRLLEQILNSQETPLRQTESSEKSSLNTTKMPTNPVVAPSLAECPQVSKPSILQTVKAPKSMLKDAERILRGVQNNKKVLEENLEAIIRAKDGDAITNYLSELQKMAKNDYEQTQYNQKDPKTPWTKRTQNTRDMKTNKEIKAKTQKTQGSLTKKHLSAAKPSQKQSEDNFRRQSLRSYSVSETLLKKEGRGPLKASTVQNEEYLSQVYGRPIYQGHRSTLKKAPYLRFNSPSPKSKPQRPKVIECTSILDLWYIDSISNDSVSINQASTSSEAALPPVSSLIQVLDQEEEDGIPELSEPILEFNRQTEVVSPKYNGPPFPPAAPASQQPADILDEIIERRETLENRLISWVEQEVMARIISGMYPVQQERVPRVSASESEESEAVTSDIVEAAGGGGFQLFVSAGVPVNSEMISHFVNEALTETIAVMLGDREAQKAVPAANVLQSTTVLPVRSVVSTPLATPPHTPLPEKEPTPVKTPVSSPSVTEIGFDIPAATTPIGTPAATPVDTPLRVTTPSPPVSEHGSDATRMGSPKPPNPWGDAELPLDEEKPSPLNEEILHPRAVVMSVAKDEEPEMLILPSPEPIRHFESLPCEPRVPSPVHAPSSGPSTHESSLTVTETETADKPISEGEVLFSYGQLVAAKALAEGGLSLPNLSESLTSTLHDANEMDYDPPSEGQVMRRPHRGYHRDPVLSLFAKLNQAPVALQEVIYHSEDSDNSVGELSEGQRPRLTRAAESILMGHSVYTDQVTGLVTEQRPHRVPSPGECDRVTGINAADVSHGPMSMAELESQPLLNPAPQTAQANDRLTSLSEDFPEVKYETVPHLSSLTSPAKMSVMLPSMNIDDQTQSISTVHGDSDSSGTDTF